MMQRHMPLGYRMVDGKIKLHEIYAPVVRKIFNDYASGISMKAIAKDLTAEGVPNANKKHNWSHPSVGNVLQNVKYKGDALYPPLIDEACFEKVQIRRSKMEKNLNHTKRIAVKRNQSVFNGILQCGDCGENYRKYVEHAGKPSEKSKWKCKLYIKDNRVFCRNHFFEDEELQQIFLGATNQLLKQKHLMNKVMKRETPKMSVELRQTDAIIKELEQIGDYSNQELPDLIFKRAKLYYTGSSINDHDQTAERLKEALIGIHQLMEFDEVLFSTIIKLITIYKDNKIAVEFINGVIIEKTIENTANELTEDEGKDGNHGSS